MNKELKQLKIDYMLMRLHLGSIGSILSKYDIDNDTSNIMVSELEKFEDKLTVAFILLDTKTNRI